MYRGLHIKPRNYQEFLAGKLTYFNKFYNECIMVLDALTAACPMLLVARELKLVISITHIIFDVLVSMIQSL